MEKGNVPELLGRRIGNLRRSRGLSQKALAEKCNIAPDFLRGIEKGKKDPTLEDLAKISKALEVELFDLARKRRGKEDISRVKREILEGIDRMEEEDREKLRLLLKILQALR